MMSKKQWFILWLLFVGYVFLGATMFYYIERPYERERRAIMKEEQNEIQELLEQHYAPESALAREMILGRLAQYCEKPFDLHFNSYNLTREYEEYDPPFEWTFYNSFFFSLITITTVGYGNMTPQTAQGRILVIFYSLFGTPFAGIVLAQLGEFFSTVFLKAHLRYKTDEYETKMALFVDVLLYLFPGLLITIFLPTIAFIYFEEWTFDKAIFYAYVTLTTIGYGDLVAGTIQTAGWMYDTYKIVIIFWMMFGLGYIAMIINFLTKGLRSKKINRIEKKLATTLKQTQTRIWNEFMSDVSHVRRVLNEMYLIKVKPVYREGPPAYVPTRSKSCPNLTEWPTPIPGTPESPPPTWSQPMGHEKGEIVRRRAYSEAGPKSGLTRVKSDSRLNLIDRGATFGNAAFAPGEIKAFVEQTVSRSATPEYTNGHLKGTNMFSDDEILASEYSTRTSANGWPHTVSSRGRTLSDAMNINPNIFNLQSGYSSLQNTWSGTPQNQTLRNVLLKNMRESSLDYVNDQQDKLEELAPPKESLRRRMSAAATNLFSFGSGSSKSKKKGQTEEKKKSEKSRKTGNVYLNATPPSAGSKHRLSLQEVSDAMSSERFREGRRQSLLLAALTTVDTPTGSLTNISPVLEQTSVADFIRVMASLQDQTESNRLSVKSTGQPPAQLPLAALFNQQNRRSSTPFTGSSSSLNLKPNPVTRLNRRRFSQIPTPPKNLTHSGSVLSLGPRPRAASVTISPLTTQYKPLFNRLGGSGKPASSSGRSTPIQSRQPPAVIVTSPEGRHRFSVRTSSELSAKSAMSKDFPSSNLGIPTVPEQPPSRKDSLNEVITKL